MTGPKPERGQWEEKPGKGQWEEKPGIEVGVNSCFVAFIAPTTVQAFCVVHANRISALHLVVLTV